MKSLILFSMLLFPSVANAADGDLIFEAATSSHVATNFTLNPTSPVLIMVSTSVVDRSFIDPVNRFILYKIQWYSFSMWNQTTSSGTYAFTPIGPQKGPDIPPVMSCDSEANVIPSASEGKPSLITESIIGFKLWGLGCADSNFDIGVTQRGR